ncbi:MAG: NUDIX domain-containing protein [Ruminococcaceae bacterium]|nr:NUDIX domain-containing protein [Oscillospiraceae bacterium]
MDYHETSAWTRYLELREARPSAFRSGALEIVTDPRLVDDFFKTTGKQLGVLYESPYHLLVVDLVRRSADGVEAGDLLFPYERLLPAAESGAVVAVPMYQGRFVLLRQYRHALREEMLAFPRGFGEKGLSGEENLRKELREEIGTAEVGNIRFLGTVAADSGILATKAEVFLCDVSRPRIEKGYEGIAALELLSESELSELIGTGKIADGFTLAAFALYAAGNRRQDA